MNAEQQRLEQSRNRTNHWKRWGSYVAERAWGTVREDYSPDGCAWEYFPHDHARSRVYRWNEDGLAGICDRHQILCFALALWNGRDPILKERLFGVSGNEGNHGEDVKECYFYLDNTPTHSYMKYLYKYPQGEYPYAALVAESRRRGKLDPEYELLDTGIFQDDRYFDVFIEYAKADVEDICIRITAANRGLEAATLHLLPTLWFRNTWAWEQGSPKPQLNATGSSAVCAQSGELGGYHLFFDGNPELLFTENETNNRRLFNSANGPYVKDAFHEYLIHRKAEAINPRLRGTKAAGHYVFKIDAGKQIELKLRLKKSNDAPTSLGTDFSQVFTQRIAEAEE